MKTKRMHFFSGLLFLSFLTASGCTSKGGSTPNPLFFKCWVHAFEEDGQDGVQNFRPCATHTLPAARYRNTFTLKDNGDVEYSVLAANDAHTTEQGKWVYDPNTKMLRISSTENTVVAAYEVVEIKEDVLKLKE